MKKQKGLIFLAVVPAIVIGAIFFGNPQPIFAAENCHIVTIFDLGNISSTNVTIAKGDCVLWMNWKRKGGVALVFKEGEKCIKAVQTSMGFKMDDKNKCFVAQWLTHGQTASLVFKEAGTYAYEILFELGGKDSATIVVTD